MATGTVYLDVDDEITSAAARIRGSEATKVALVVPYGSRIATSRMNFRLLSREAIVNNRRLSIVASDAATRALAASAGLPVFASVAEYDAATAGGSGSSGGDAAAAIAVADAVEPGAAGDGEADDRRSAAATAATVAAAGATLAAVATPGPAAPTLRDGSAASSVSDETQQLTLPPAGAAAAAAGAGAGAFSQPPTPASSSRVSSGHRTSVPVTRSRRMPRIGTAALIVAGIAVIGLAALAVAGYVYLPSAAITVTPRAEPIPPISLTVRADPDATGTDAQAGVVPASRIDVPVSVSDTFTTTGKRVEEAQAKGTVTFRNVDFTRTNTIAGGSIVSTQSGVRFRTDRAVTVGKAHLVGLQVVPTEANVGVTAVKPGEAGNVEPNTITVIPAAEDPLTLSVRNKAATSGGTHQEFPQVSQADVNNAIAKLTKDLNDSFQAAVADSSGAPDNATIYPDTAVLGDPTPSVDPATLVGQGQPTFDLGLSADGSVVAVDDSPVEGIARERLMANVGPGYKLIDDSVRIQQGDATVANGQVSFPVTASASRVRVLDPAQLLALAKGKSIADAKAALAPFGDVKITPWPDWVSSVPTIDSRVTLQVVGQTGQGGGESGSASPPATGSP